MVDIFFHIGPHKTGTSYLQKKFFENAELLKEHGFTYPVDDISSGLPGHHKWAHMIKGRPEKRKLAAEEIATVARGSKALLLSSEIFSLVNETAWRELQEQLYPDHKFIFILFLRKRSDSIYSMWQEKIKWGSKETLQEYVGTCEKDAYQNPQMNIMSILERLPCEDTDYSRIAVYDNLTENSIDIFEFFCEKILGISGWKSRTPSKIGRVNASFDYAFIEVLRLLNSIYIEDSERPTDKLRNTVFTLYSNNDEIRNKINEFRNILSGYKRDLDLSYLDTQYSGFDRQLMKKYGTSVINAKENDPFDINHISKPNIKNYVEIPDDDYPRIRSVIEEFYDNILSMSVAR